MATKKRTTKTRSTSKRKATRKTVARRTCTRKRTCKRTSRKNQTNEAYGWEILPFVVAVIVAFIVVIQSMSSVQSELTFSPTGGRGRTMAPSGTMHFAAPQYHGASDGCVVDGATHRQIQAAERALARGLDLLQDAQLTQDWDCSTDPRGTLCKSAKANLEHMQSVVQDLSGEYQEVQIGACL